MRATFLGTGAGTSTPGRAGTSILIDAGAERLLLDCGNRSFDRLVDLQIEPATIDRIFISHLHPDHVLGLSEFVSCMAFPGDHLPAEVVGPPGTAAFVRSAVHAASLVTGRPRREYGAPLDVPVSESVDGDSAAYPGYIVHTVDVPHAHFLVCQARRIEAEGKVLVFSGDTRADPETMVPLAQGADILIHEAWSNAGLNRWTKDDDPGKAQAIRRAFETTHALADTVGRIAREAGVRTLVLTHLNPGERADELINTVRAHYSGEVVVAVDRLSLAV